MDDPEKEFNTDELLDSREQTQLNIEKIIEELQEQEIFAWYLVRYTDVSAYSEAEQQQIGVKMPSQRERKVAAVVIPINPDRTRHLIISAEDADMAIGTVFYLKDHPLAQTPYGDVEFFETKPPILRMAQLLNTGLSYQKQGWKKSSDPDANPQDFADAFAEAKKTATKLAEESMRNRLDASNLILDLIENPPSAPAAPPPPAV